MNTMTLHQSIMQYLVYLKASGISAQKIRPYQQVLVDVETFYGPAASLEDFDSSQVLEYVKENDPFDTDPIKVERGELFCEFTHWLMKNNLIPAWANEMKEMESEKA